MCGLTTSSLAASDFHAGQYPAIDRLLARKQAITKLHELGASATFNPRMDNILQPKAPAHRVEPSTSDGLQLFQSQQLSSQQCDTSSVWSPSHDVYALEQPTSCQVALPSADVSELAQGQYLCFKARRQERQAAAIHIQKHIRGLLARRLCTQLRCIDSHRKLIQHRMLSNCMQAWRGIASSQSRFRWASCSKPVT